MKPEIVRADFSTFFSNVAAVEAALALKPFVKPNPRKEGESIMDYTNRLKALRAAERAEEAEEVADQAAIDYCMENGISWEDRNA